MASSFRQGDLRYSFLPWRIPLVFRQEIQGHINLRKGQVGPGPPQSLRGRACSACSSTYSTTCWKTSNEQACWYFRPLPKRHVALEPLVLNGEGNGTSGHGVLPFFGVFGCGVATATMPTSGQDSYLASRHSADGPQEGILGNPIPCLRPPWTPRPGEISLIFSSSWDPPG